jgi:MFS family permease
MDRTHNHRPRLPHNLWVVTVTSFLTDISSEMLTSLLPIFLFSVLGVRTALIGLIEGVAEATASLLKVFSGWFSDRQGRRKPLAVLGYGLSAVAKACLYFAASWGWVLGVRFADRAGKGLRTAPRDALVAGSIEAEHRGLAFGLHRAGDTAGAFTGLLLAWLVLRVVGAGEGLERSAFQTLVLLSLIPASVAVLVLALGAREMRGSAGPATRQALSPVGLDRRFLSFLGIVVLFTLGNSSDAFLILRAQDAGLSVGGVLGMMITFNLVYAVVSTPAGVLSDRLGRQRLLMAGWLLYALVYACFAALREGWQAWVCMAAYGVYYGLTEGVARALIADLVVPERQGTAYGLYHAAVGLAALPASLIAGVLWQGAFGWEGFGAPAPFVFGALMALAAALLIAMIPASLPVRRVESP